MSLLRWVCVIGTERGMPRSRNVGCSKVPACRAACQAAYAWPWIHLPPLVPVAPVVKAPMMAGSPCWSVRPASTQVPAQVRALFAMVSPLESIQDPDVPVETASRPIVSDPRSRSSRVSVAAQISRVVAHSYCVTPTRHAYSWLTAMWARVGSSYSDHDGWTEIT